MQRYGLSDPAEMMTEMIVRNGGYIGHKAGPYWNEGLYELDY